jgi:hypothetical protein
MHCFSAGSAHQKFLQGIALLPGLQFAVALGRTEFECFHLDRGEMHFFAGQVSRA